MIQTAIALTFAHLLADFVLQSGHMARTKNRPWVLLQHVSIVALSAWIALGFAPVPVVIAVIAVTHAVFDWLKHASGATGLRPFVIDQSAHLAVIALTALFFPDSFTQGIFSIAPDNPLPINTNMILQAMVLSSALIAALPAGGHMIGALMQEIDLPRDDDAAVTLRKGGRMIGRLERLLILMLVLTDQTTAIGFLIAAKSVLRFSELSRDRTHLMSEYIIIGTLASFAWGLGCAFATRIALGALTP